MGKFIFGQEYKCSAQLAIAVEGLFKAARVGLVIPALLHAAPAKLHTALRCVSQGMDGIWGYHLWFLSVRYFISPGTPRAQAWKCLWHSLMLMWVFRAPLLHSCFSFPHVLLGSDLLCFFFFFFPPFGFMAKVILWSNRRKDPSRKPFVFCLAGRIELGSGSSTSYPSSPGCWWSYRGHCEGGGAPSSLCLGTITLKLINLNATDLKLMLESGFGLRF